VTSPGNPGVSGPGVLTVSPLRLSDLVAATPLGNLSYPGHVFPTDHVYFYFADPGNLKPGDMDTARTVYAPGTGLLTNSYTPGPPDYDNAIEVRMTNTFTYFMGHLILAQGFRVGDSIRAGMVIGTTSNKVSYAVDFAVWNTEVTLTGFVRPDRYPAKTLHSVAPYPFFAAPLRDSLYAKINCTGSNKGGKIDYDLPGYLVGNWFLKGLPAGDSSYAPNAYLRQLSFVYDMTDPSSIRICIGGSLAFAGIFGVVASSPDPATVSAARGIVAYQVARSYVPSVPGSGFVLAQVLSRDTIRVEAFPGTSPPGGFDNAAMIYTR